MDTETPPPAEDSSGASDASGTPWLAPSDRDHQTRAAGDDASVAPVVPDRPLDPPPPSRSRRLIVAGTVVAVTGLLGFPLGWLWSTAAPWLPVYRSGDALYLADQEGEQLAAAESWFMLLSFGAGILFAVVAWFALRRFRGPLMIGALAVGSIVTGWLAWRFGHNIGRGAAIEVARKASDGTTLKIPPDLRIRSGGVTGESIGHWHGIPYIGGVLLFVAVASVFVYVLLTVFSLSPSLGLHRRAEAAADAEYERTHGGD